MEITEAERAALIAESQVFNLDVMHDDEMRNLARQFREAGQGRQENIEHLRNLDRIKPQHSEAYGTIAKALWA